LPALTGPRPLLVDRATSDLLCLLLGLPALNKALFHMGVLALPLLAPTVLRNQSASLLRAGHHQGRALWIGTTCFPPCHPAKLGDSSDLPRIRGANDLTSPRRQLPMAPLLRCGRISARVRRTPGASPDWP
jgi:hypothetical protein